MIAGEKVSKVDGFFICRTWPASEQQETILFKEFAFDKKLVVCRVTQVGGLFIQNDLCITRERQNTRVSSMIGKTYPPDFYIIVGSHAHDGSQNDITILPFELDAVRVKVHLTPVW